MYIRLKNLLHKYSYLYQTLKTNYNFLRSFIFITPILMIMNI